MRSAGAGLLLVLSLAAQAQEALVVKSFTVGMPRAAALAAMPRLECLTPDTCFLNAPSVCRNIAPGHIEALSACLEPYLYGGRMPATWAVRFHQSQLVGVTVTIGEATFAEIVEALVTRFGAPLRDEPGVVVNRMGVKFEQRILTWSRGGATLRATRRASTMDRSTVTLSDDQHALRLLEEHQRSAKDRAKGI